MAGRFKAIYIFDNDFAVAPLAKGGWGVFYKDKRCLDYMGQTGLGKRFATAKDAATAIATCKFDPLEAA